MRERKARVLEVLVDGADEGHRIMFSKLPLCKDAVKELSAGEEVDLCPDAHFV